MRVRAPVPDGRPVRRSANACAMKNNAQTRFAVMTFALLLVAAAFYLRRPSVPAADSLRPSFALNLVDRQISSVSDSLLRAELRFEIDPPVQSNLIRIKTQLPDGATGRIIQAGPADPSRLADIVSRSDESGRSAEFTAMAREMKELVWRIDLDSPATVILDGSGLQNPLTLKIQP